MRAYDLAASIPWAITPEGLRGILEIAEAHLSASADRAAWEERIQAVEARLGRPLDNAREVTTRGGVATIPVTGPIFRYADMFTRLSGAVSIETLATDLQAAMDAPAIHSIVLAIDSPGGEANGTPEFADMVRSAANVKPVTAYVSGMGASAAYWIASAASHIVVDQIALLGSIGVVQPVRDPSKERAATIDFVSSQSPRKRPNPTTAEGRGQIQGMVDALADVFIAAVARNRDVSPETVASDFGRGGLLVGQAAVDVGLADAVGSYEQVLAGLMDAGGRAPQFTGARLSGVAAQSTIAAGGMTVAEQQDDTAAKAYASEQAARQAEQRAAQLSAQLDQERAERERERAAYAQERQARQVADITASVEALVRDGKLAVHAQDTARTLLIQAMHDDMRADADGLPHNGQTRVTALTAFLTAQELHGMDRETVAVGETITFAANPPTLPRGQAQQLKDLDQVEANARAYAERANRAGARKGK